jgi:hypothetical protein
MSFRFSPFIIALMALAGTAQADLFDDEVTHQELAEALIHCAEEASQLLPDARYRVASVTGRYQQLSEKISWKRYTIKTVRANALEPLVGGPKLHVDLKITQKDAQDAPAQKTWRCILIK